MPQRGEKQREREWGCSGTDILPTEREEERQLPKRGKKPNPSSSFFLFRLLLRRAARAPDEPLGLSVFSLLFFYSFDSFPSSFSQTLNSGKHGRWKRDWRESWWGGISAPSDSTHHRNELFSSYSSSSYAMNTHTQIHENTWKIHFNLKRKERREEKTGTMNERTAFGKCTYVLSLCNEEEEPAVFVTRCDEFSFRFCFFALFIWW